MSTTPADSNIIGWALAGNNISALITNLDLMEGINYYGNVRAYDEAGNASSIKAVMGLKLTSGDLSR